MLQVQIKDNKIYSPLRDQMLTLMPEERVRQEYICHLVNHYGYSLDQMWEEVKVSNSQRGSWKARADIVIWKSKEDRDSNKHAFIVVECKAQNVKIQRQDYFQGANYASWTHAQFFVTTNEKEVKFFKTWDTIPIGFLDEINDIPNAKDIGNDKKIAEILSQTKAFTRDEFQNLLFQCHNVIRNNDKLSPEMAFDEISKILFMKIRYERNVGKNSVFTKDRFEVLRGNDDEVRSKTDLPFYQKLFEKTKEDFKYAEIFEENDMLRIREASFLQIVKLLEKYNLSDTSDDVKWIAFEQFLGRTFRGDLGQFFTPRTIVRFMTDVLNPREWELVCDPCCGTGWFLINAFEYMRTQIEIDIESQKKTIRNQLLKCDFDTLNEEDQEKVLDNMDPKVQESIDGAFAELNNELDPSYEWGRLYNLSRDYIFGTDAEPRSARTAKMNMIMHGDGHAWVHHHDGLLNVNGIFEGRFDVILTNPPFGARVSKDLLISDTDRYTDEKRIKYYSDLYGDEYKKALEQITKNIGKSVLDLYDLGSTSTLTEILFMERNLRLLKQGGRMGVVLPEWVLNNSQLQSVREYFEWRAKIILIVSIPQDVFMAAGATVKPSLLFLKKFTQQEVEQYEVIQEQAKKSVLETHKIEKETLEKTLKSGSKEEKQKTKLKLKELEELIKKEIRSNIKEAFDYEIPVAQVGKAGIGTTGGVIENELVPVVNEFHKYARLNPLWETKGNTYNYNQSGKRK